ncbi:MAG: hypothetical protein IPM32_18280 [Ignavibacteriae bacterium]|nr:hypothetical protein [Ignavibacteriota bacterium]
MKSFYSLFILFFVFNLSIAQTDCENDVLDLKHGLQFQVRTLSLSDFNGYTFAYRYLLNNNSGLRIGIFANISDENFTENHLVDSSKFNSPQENINYDLKFSVQYIKTIMRKEDFSFIMGFGPFIAYQKRESNANDYGHNYTREYLSKYNSTSFGLDILMGVEYNLSNNVILSGEYGLAMSIGSLDSKRTENFYYNDAYEIDQKHEEKSEGTLYLVKGIGASLGLSIFF